MKVKKVTYSAGPTEVMVLLSESEARQLQEQLVLTKFNVLEGAKQTPVSQLFVELTNVIKR